MLQELKEEGKGVQVVDEDVLGVVGLEHILNALCKREERNHVEGRYDTGCRFSCLLVIVGEMPQGTYGRVQEVRVASIPPHDVDQGL